MDLWTIAFFSLCLTSIAGMTLFFGYAFRVRLHYPFTLVVLHMIFSLFTTVLYTIALFKTLFEHPSWLYTLLFATSLVTVIATFVAGFIFFVRFNARKRQPTRFLIGVHITMAAVAFIMLTSSTISISSLNAEANQTTHAHNSYNYNFYKHLHQRQNKSKR